MNSFCKSWEHWENLSREILQIKLQFLLILINSREIISATKILKKITYEGRETRLFAVRREEDKKNQSAISIHWNKSKLEPK